MTTWHELYWSANGGRTWVPQSLPAPTGMKPQPSLYLPVPATFFDNREGVLLAVPNEKGVTRTIVYVTHDGGATWRVGAVPADTDPFVISFTNPGHGWASRVWMPTEKRDALVFTADEGITWLEVATNVDLTNIYQMQFVTARDGWGLARDDGNGSVLLRTTDGGHNWMQVDPGN